MKEIKTSGDLLNRIQEYYKENYNEVQIQDIKEWFIIEKIPDEMMEGFYNLIVDNFKFYKSLPGRKDLNEIKNMAVEQQTENAWLQLTEIKFVRSFLCTDIIIQETIKVMGGIDLFIGYRNEHNTFAHKDFVKNYIRLLQSGYFKNKKPEILYCEYDRMYPKFPNENFISGLLIIGDKQKGRLILKEQKILQLENKNEMQSIGNVINDLKIG